MKRSPLKRKTAMNRSPKRAKPAQTKYKARDRDTEYMRWVKTLRCAVTRVPADWLGIGETTPCSGPIEADHMGARPLGRKASDKTCVPMCTKHHRERTDHSGMFRMADQEQLRQWRARAMFDTQERQERASRVANAIQF